MGVRRGDAESSRHRGGRLLGEHDDGNLPVRRLASDGASVGRTEEKPDNDVREAQSSHEVGGRARQA